MIDVNKITAQKLADHLRAVEPDLMARVEPEKAGVLCSGACHSLQQQDKGRGR